VLVAVGDCRSDLAYGGQVYRRLQDSSHGCRPSPVLRSVGAGEPEELDHDVNGKPGREVAYYVELTMSSMTVEQCRNHGSDAGPREVQPPR
jgi:hypothetical protein